MYLNNSLFRTAQLWPDRVAIATPERTATWRETLDRVLRLAGALQRRVPDQHGRIAVFGLNSAEFVETTLAAPMAGRPLMTVNYRLSLDELRHTFAECAASVLLFDAAAAEMVESLRGDLACAFVYWGPEASRPAFAEPYEALIAANDVWTQPELASTDTWAVIPSGGTTGRPKAIELSHGAMAFTVASTLQVLDLGEAPSCLHVAPLFHLAGFTASYAITATGGTHAFLPTFSVDGLLTELERNRSTLTNLVPTMIGWLVAHPDLAGRDLSALRNITYGASTITQATLRRLLERLPGVRLNQFYGQTEACGALTCLLPGDHDVTTGAHRLASAGRPLPGVRLEIMDPSGAPLARGETGEICARTDALFTRYVGHDALRREAVRDGWLRTGDVGRIDDDGFLYVTDRLKDMIVTGGENVSASEVENVLSRHEAVVQVAVVAAPDPVWGERVHAFVVTKPNSDVTEPALDALCRDALAAYKRPRSYTLQVDPLPTTGAGKVQKAELRARLLESVS